MLLCSLSINRLLVTPLVPPYPAAQREAIVTPFKEFDNMSQDIL